MGDWRAWRRRRSLCRRVWSHPFRIGLAERARDLAIERVKKKTSVAMSRSMAYHPEVQHAIAQIFIEVEGMIAQVDRIADDWTKGVDHGELRPAKLVAAKYRCVEGAFRVADLALDVSGGRGMFRGDELERLYRDSRCGRFHPANSMVIHEVDREIGSWHSGRRWTSMGLTKKQRCEGRLARGCCGTQRLDSS